MKTLVIGEAPSKWMAENGVIIPLPLARRELAALAGIIPPRFDELFECANVLDRWPGKQGKGDAFPLDLARPAAIRMADGFQGRRVILLGDRVRRAFCLRDRLPILKFTPWEFAASDGSRSILCDLAVCPHPSGINTWWNEPQNRIDARIFWGSLVPERIEA